MNKPRDDLGQTQLSEKTAVSDRGFKVRIMEARMLLGLISPKEVLTFIRDKDRFCFFQEEIMS